MLIRLSHLPTEQPCFFSEVRSVLSGTALHVVLFRSHFRGIQCRVADVSVNCWLLLLLEIGIEPENGEVVIVVTTLIWHAFIVNGKGLLTLLKHYIVNGKGLLTLLKHSIVCFVVAFELLLSCVFQPGCPDIPECSWNSVSPGIYLKPYKLLICQLRLLIINIQNIQIWSLIRAYPVKDFVVLLWWFTAVSPFESHVSH